MRFLPNPSASVAYNVNPVADQFQRAFQTLTFVSFEALDKGAIEILGPYGISYTFRRLAERISQLQSGSVVRRVRYDPWPPARWGRLLRCRPELLSSASRNARNPLARKGCRWEGLRRVTTLRRNEPT
ncbi:NADH-ubiquinone oxidoreductase chain 5 [Nymphaea thermarum]|nr:NADH-ubiquinone oxidoreductase chain 5 [Nymphaea thermarum]